MQGKTQIDKRDPKERSKDFNEVNLGYSKEQAVKEAKRCIQCKKPFCVDGCPVEINIPEFIKKIAEDDPKGAIEVLKDKNNLPAVCGRVCPQEEQCEVKCILGKKGEPIAIGYLERYAADWEKENLPEGLEQKIESNPDTKGKKVAIVGSGPAGLTAAGDLAKMGYSVTIFESLHKHGGVLGYGIPEFRLPEKVLDYELNNIKKLGVKLETNVLIGRTKSIQGLFDDGFKSIFIGVGAGLPKFMNIPGENLNNMYSANEFLVRVNLMHAFEFPKYDTPIQIGKRVAVIGGGNTAMDSARTALRLGAEEVMLIYRRSREEMPARNEEIHHAEEEGIKMMLLNNPVAYYADDKGFVNEMECVKMELGEPDDSGRRRPKVIEGSNYKISVDLVVVAVGLSPNPLIPSLTKGLKTNKWGELEIDENFMTTLPGVFAGGDITGGGTVIQAMGMGKKAARAMDAYLSKP